ncbi:MAG: hypothetical protein LKF30_07140 [Sphingobium sp.]|jgi:hypothetical protein|nr:hypothetical protein [Sphingobium sp.]MCI1754769.1 hypothetical protein [Sphingobium sp.]MCI2054416.1 hypothetical protein [Sphingobium sp.]
MNGTLANVVGLMGSALFITAFLYSNMAQSMNFVLFNILNLAGAFLLILSLSVHFNLAAMVMEIAWAIIASFGLVKALRARRP